MHITDPIADMLTRIRNANSAKHSTVDVPASNMKKAIAKILLDEGYIKNYQLIDDGTQGTIRIAVFPSPACVSTPAQTNCPRFSVAWVSRSYPPPRAS